MENSEAIVGTVNYLHYKERIIILISLSLIILLQNYDHFFIHENFKAFEFVHFYAFCKLRATNFNLGWNITKKIHFLSLLQEIEFLFRAWTLSPRKFYLMFYTAGSLSAEKK